MSPLGPEATPALLSCATSSFVQDGPTPTTTVSAPVGRGRQLEKTAAVGPVRRRLAGRAVRLRQVETAGGGRRGRRALMEEVSRVEDAYHVGVPGDLRRAARHEALGGTGEGSRAAPSV